MNEVVGVGAIISALAASITTFVKVIVDDKKNGNSKGNSNNRPGTSKVCIDRGEKIAVIENQISGFKEDFNDIKGTLKNIENKIK